MIYASAAQLVKDTSTFRGDEQHLGSILSIALPLSAHSRTWPDHELAQPPWGLPPKLLGLNHAIPRYLGRTLWSTYQVPTALRKGTQPRGLSQRPCVRDQRLHAQFSIETPIRSVGRFADSYVDRCSYRQFLYCVPDQLIFRLQAVLERA